jgi:hypothetical protein
MPIGCTGHAGTVGVNFLMTTGTIQGRHAFAFVTAANDVGEMASAIIALLGIVGGRMTIDAARGNQN